MSELKYDINKIIEEIMKCYNDGYYLAALMETLVLPDICCKIEETKTGKKCYYSDWCNRWLRYLPKLSADAGYKGTWGNVLFKLRCSILHNAEIDILDEDYVFFNLKDFDLYIEDWLPDLSNTMCIRTQITTGGCRSKKEKNVQHIIDIEIRFFIKVIIDGVHEFMKSYELDLDDFPSINIEMRS